MDAHTSRPSRFPNPQDFPQLLARTQYQYALALRARGAPGDVERAERLLAEARSAAAASGMAGLLAMVAAQDAPITTLPEPAGAQIFCLEGEFWTIVYADRVIRLRDTRGLHYLETLLRHPGREFHASELADRKGGATRAVDRDTALRITSGLGDAGEYLDRKARAAYRQRLAELAEQAADAERRNDLGWLERGRAEREALLAELEAGARGRRASAHAERARTAVTKAIKLALAKIDASHPPLGAHLAATIHRGYFCAYRPDPRHPVEWLG